MIQEVRRTRHDMKNNMIYLKELLNTDAEKARKFLDEYIGQSEATDEISKSGNLAVRAEGRRGLPDMLYKIRC